MLSFLKEHPFPVEAFFERSVVLTYAVPAEDLVALLPSCFMPDTHDGKTGFIAAAFVQTRGLRPKGFPSFMGHDFILGGYRIFVRYHTSKGKRLRGLYILGSETDKRKMVWLGNLFTRYKYRFSNIKVETGGSTKCSFSCQTDGLLVRLGKEGTVALPRQSPFADWKEARRFAGPLPFTFSVTGQNVVIIEGVRENWTPQPVEVLHAEIPFLKTLPVQAPNLASAFCVENIPYQWKKGYTDQWSR